MLSRDRRNNVHLSLERLEDRSLLSAGMMSPGGHLPVMMPSNFGPEAALLSSATPSAASFSQSQAPILPALGTPKVVSTMPGNGDVNPYGVAFVPQDIARGGSLHPGDVLVSNFNNGNNVQGTGTTIVRITPRGQQSVFFQGPTGLGLTTALGVLKSGFVLVGNVPSTTDNMGNLVANGSGSLLILDANGHVVETLKNSQLLDGPWDLTVNDLGNFAQVFVSNVLNGTVTRIDLLIPPGGKPFVLDMTRIASGYGFGTNPAAFLVGPTGLAFDAQKDILYVASTADNAIFAIPNAAIRFGSAGTGRLIYQDPVHLHGPLGLVLAPNGDLITANGDAINPDPNNQNELVEFTPTGKFVAQLPVDTGPTNGAAFGIALQQSGDAIRFAAVDDTTNSVEIFTINR